MTTALDVWRAVDPEARVVSGSAERLRRPVRVVSRTRAAPPHLPPAADSQLLVVDASIMADGNLDQLLAALGEAELAPVAVWVAAAGPAPLERAGADVPVLAGPSVTAAVADAATTYLERERDHLAALAVELRLAGAEAALADPQPAAPAGVVAARLRRGVAVTIDGALSSLNARPAGRALATGFAAAYARLLADRATRPSQARRTRDGLWIMERTIGPRATAWLFDDLPFARVDEVALDSLAVTLRALLRRPVVEQGAPPARDRRLPRSTGDPMRDTLLAVARANGRIAPAARALGVHRNTVLYRLRRASAELGVDPRRPADALRLLGDDRTSDISG